MTTVRSSLTAALILVAGCSRANEAPQPKAIAEPAPDAAPRDAGMQTKAPPSAFSVVARAPMTYPSPYLRDIGRPLPLVQRLPGGGLVVASEYARARSDGPGALSVELLGEGFEHEILYRPMVTMGVEALRWVWSDASTSIVVDEEETSRSGPRLFSYKLGAKGFASFEPPNVGYWSAVVRDGSVLALARTAYEVPNSSMYPKDSGYEANEWRLKPARVAILAGKGAAPAIPPGVCPTGMSAAPDGTVAITVDKCNAEGDASFGVLRFAPSSTQAKVEWIGTQSRRGAEPDDVAVFAASASAIYVAFGDQLETWDGREWTASTPFRNEKLGSISRAPDGTLWAVLKEDGRLVKRTAESAAWSDVSLPLAPADPLDEQAFTAPTFVSSFVAVRGVPKDDALRPATSAPMMARMVDATGDDVVVLANVEREAFVLSTKPRTPVARLPSITAQRARIAQTLKRRTPKSPKDCLTTFLLFSDPTSIDAIRASLGDAGPTAKIGEAIVEGEKHIVLYGEDHAAAAAAKRVAQLAPKELCGPPVVIREL
jgi:hypothetical protein